MFITVEGMEVKGIEEEDFFGDDAAYRKALDAWIDQEAFNESMSTYDRPPGGE